MSKQKMPGYIALVLDANTAEICREGGTLANVHSKHVMIAFRPKREVYNKYAHLLGQTIKFRIIGVCHDEKAQVWLVDGVPSENKHPHITRATAEGIPPAYSNELLASRQGKPDHMIEFEGRGTVQFVRYF